MKIFSICLLLVGQHTVRSEVFSSVKDMEKVFKLERDLVNVMLDFARKTEQKLNTIKKYLSEYSTTLYGVDEGLIADDAAYSKVLAENPVHAYNVVKRLTVDFSKIEEELRRDDWRESELTVQRLRLGSVVPKERDLHGAAQALIRLQDVYELDISQLVQGKVGKRHTSARLTAQDCLFLGKHCFNSGILSRSLEWFEEAWHLAGEERNATITQDQVKQFLDHAAREHDERVMKGERGENLFPRPVYEEAPQEQRTKIIKSISINTGRKTSLNGTELGGFTEEREDSIKFSVLCRGDQVVTPTVPHNEEADNLTPMRLDKCSYQHRGQPFFYLQPVKVEEVHKNPDIMLFHDIINRNELDELKVLAQPQMARSQVLGGNANNEVSSTRTSKTGWLSDTKSPTVKRLAKRINLVTGLHTDSEKDDAELLQIANYMNGGHYNPHHDYVIRGRDPQHMIYVPNKNLYIGDRIATWMFYMSEVGEGGRTVFPRLGVGVDPVPGSAVFWYNILPSGEADTRTLHGACPVLYGTKWVANKWIREGPQLFIRPCPADAQFRNKLSNPGYVQATSAAA